MTINRLKPRKNSRKSPPDSASPYTRFDYCSIKLDKPLDLVASARKRIQVGGTIDLSQVGNLDRRLMARRHEVLTARDTRAFFDYTRLHDFIVNALCIQPVSIRDDDADPNPTGAGLDFGMPGARTQWRKADVVFSVREWEYINNSNYKRVSSDREVADLRDSVVNNESCVEIFFANTFSRALRTELGGGGTYGSGTTGAQIVSSDENAAAGIDLTHLAHELGHVMSLLHPGPEDEDRPWMRQSSTGTLMCGSGFRRDNPTINSTENRDHIESPLFYFRLAARGGVTDCADSVDCGACPEID